MKRDVWTDDNLMVLRPEAQEEQSGIVHLMAAADSVAVWLAAAGLDPGAADGWFQPYELRGEGGVPHDGLEDDGLASHQALPLVRQQVVDFVVQLSDFQLGF